MFNTIVVFMHFKTLNKCTKDNKLNITHIGGNYNNVKSIHVFQVGIILDLTIWLYQK